MTRYHDLIIGTVVVLMIFSKHSIAHSEEKLANVQSYRLSLDETTDLALRNNFDIQLTKYDTLIARTDELAARSIYDTVFDAQVEYRDGATDEDALEKLKYDLYYIKNANLLFDLWIVVKTIKVVLLGTGAR